MKVNLDLFFQNVSVKFYIKLLIIQTLQTDYWTVLLITDHPHYHWIQQIKMNKMLRPILLCFTWMILVSVWWRYTNCWNRIGSFIRISKNALCAVVNWSFPQCLWPACTIQPPNLSLGETPPSIEQYLMTFNLYSPSPIIYSLTVGSFY